MPGFGVTILGPMGRGAHGTVSRVRLDAPWGGHAAGAEFALKRPTSEEAASRVEAEAEALAALEGAQVPRLIEAGRDGTGPYVLMELIEGPSLAEELLLGPASPESLLSSARSCLEAIAGLHSRGWLHGDLSPQNVRRHADGSCVLLDLGSASRLGEVTRGRGTPAYLSPEEARGVPKSMASEIWSLGVVLWELAAGRHPLSPDGSASGVPEGAALAGISAPPSIQNPACPPALDEVLGWMLHEEPSLRPTAREAVELLTAPQGSRTDEDPWAARDCLPLAGRTALLASLENTWEEAAQGRGQLVWLAGERGLGKTRLLQELARRLRRGPLPPTVLVTRCQQALEGRPTHPIRALLRHWLALGRHTAPRPRDLQRLESVLPRERAAAVAQLLDPELLRPPATEVALLTEWLEATSRATPLLVFVDGAQRAGEATLEVLLRLADGLEELPICLVLGTRDPVAPESPGLGPILGAAAAERFVSLERLGIEDLVQLVEEVFVTRESPARLAQVLLDRTEGKPSRLDALVRMGLDHGLLRVHPDGGLELVASAEALPHIDDAGEALATRIARLRPEDRNLLEWIAVGGTSVRPARLERLSLGTPEELASALERLRLEGWLTVGSSGWALPGTTQRDAVLGGLPVERRRSLHGSLADALAGQQGLGRAFQRVHHLEAAGRGHEVVQAALDLLPQARALGHPQRVLQLVRSALGAAEELPVGESLELHAAAANAAGALGHRAEESHHLDALAALPLDPERDAAPVARVYLLHGHAAADLGRAGLARGYLRNAAELASHAADPNLESEALRRLAQVELATGRIAEARELARRARSCAERRLTGLHAHVVIGTAALLEDRPARARAHARAILQGCRAEAPDLQRSEVLACALLLEGRAVVGLGQPERAVAHFRAAGAHADDAGERALSAEALARLGRAWIELGQEGQAERALREGLLVSQEIGVGPGVVLLRVFLGTLLAEQGQVEGHRLIEKAVSHADSLGLPRLESYARAVLARVRLEEGNLEAAEEESHRACGLLHRAGAELGDRVAIEGTRELVLRWLGDLPQAERVAAGVRTRLSTVLSRVRTPAFRERMQRALTASWETARSPEGPLIPRAQPGAGPPGMGTY